MNQDMKKMKTRYWYGQSIKNPQKVLAAFFDFQDLNSAINFIASICTYASTHQKYQPSNTAMCILNVFALQSLLVCCHNLLNTKDWPDYFNKLLLQKMDANQAMTTKDTVMKAMYATYNMYTLKNWRQQLFEILCDALWDKIDDIDYNVTLIYLRLSDFLNAAHMVHKCINENKKAPN